ncbi:hypothetical protein Tco_1261534 [Tanacetum coccineum]
MEAKMFENQRCILTGADVDVRDMLSSVPYVVVSVGEQSLLESSRTKDHLQDYQGCHQVEDDSSSMYTSDSDAELEVKGLKTVQKQELSG